ncbi:MAG: hypothetical protein NEHIOOID_00502 [Holosporales bacterium]
MKASTQTRSLLIEEEKKHADIRIFPHPYNPGFFDLSSHKRMKDAFDFALKIRSFHVAVIGEDQSGRMASTVAYLEEFAKQLPPPDDLIYLNNFHSSHKPIPYKLPNGMGKIFKKKITDLFNSINLLINQLLNSVSYRQIVESLSAQIQYDIDTQFKNLGEFAHEKGFKIEQSEEGFNIDAIHPDKDFSVDDFKMIRERLSQATLDANYAGQEANRKILEFRRMSIQNALHPLYDRVKKKFPEHLHLWIDAFELDVLEHIDDFINEEEIGQPKKNKELEDRYAVNLFVDHTGVRFPKVYLESNPTFETLFGSVQYMTNQALGVIDTNFTMLKAGALHYANGGFLVLRADALAKDPQLWEALKSALRDRRIRIHEHHRDNTLPIHDAPQPQSIALDVQVYLVASPFWYYNFLSDPDFENYFKIKAEIDTDMPLNESNLKAYTRLLSSFTKSSLKKQLSKSALHELVAYSHRLLDHNEKITAQIEILFDVIKEAAAFCDAKKTIQGTDIINVLFLRNERHNRIEQKAYEDIQNGIILIDTQGEKVGQVNGLTVLDVGDHEFGLPSRISARTFIGDKGIINIERLTQMAGPIQQKGAFILEGFINGLFAQEFPLSCGCSITFEQSYGDVDGDSASMAELISILSALAKTPVRQDIAITGSMNQMGYAQAVGGVCSKVEGFFKLCQMRGLTGQQGVILPKSNLKHLTLLPHIQHCIDEKKFHIHGVDHVYEAINILFNEQIPNDMHHDNSLNKILNIPLFKKVYSQLEHNHKVLKTQYTHCPSF